MALPPISVCIVSVVCFLLTHWWRYNLVSSAKPLQNKTSSAHLVLLLLRIGFVFVIVGTLWSSYVMLSNIEICDDEGVGCLKFAGLIQFTTFTRWCFILEGVYFVAANLEHYSLVFLLSELLKRFFKCTCTFSVPNQ